MILQNSVVLQNGLGKRVVSLLESDPGQDPGVQLVEPLPQIVEIVDRGWVLVASLSEPGEILADHFGHVLEILLLGTYSSQRVGLDDLVVGFPSDCFPLSGVVPGFLDIEYFEIANRFLDFENAGLDGSEDRGLVESVGNELILVDYELEKDYLRLCSLPLTLRPAL